jgi:hypothetical protein
MAHSAFRIYCMKEYDDVIGFTLQYVLNIALSDEAWNQANLPVASGGVGIRKATQPDTGRPPGFPVVCLWVTFNNQAAVTSESIQTAKSKFLQNLGHFKNVFYITLHRLEPSSLARDDGKHSDGLSLIQWENGGCLVWDVTCQDTLSLSHLNAAVSGHGIVATEAEEIKRH